MSGAFSGGWGGTDVDLTENEVSAGVSVLQAGEYDATSTSVEIKKGANGQTLEVVLSDDNGYGQITQRFNIVNSSAEAQRIGRDQLKTFLTHGGHPDPDHPMKHAKEAMVGLKVRIGVDFDGTYVKNNRESISWRVRRMGPRDERSPRGPDHNAIAAANAALGKKGGGSSSSKSASSGGGSLGGMNDDIPFAPNRF